MQHPRQSLALQFFPFTFYRCATETNIWKRLKRIVELKKDHETARKEMEKKQIETAIHFLSDLIEEWDKIIYRYLQCVKHS